MFDASGCSIADIVSPSAANKRKGQEDERCEYGTH